MGNKSDKCPSCKYRIDPGGWAACDGCIHDEGLKDRYEPLTNADRIRNMTDEEMADFVATYVHCEDCWLVDNCVNCGDMTCYDNILSFLHSPVEETE